MSTTSARASGGGVGEQLLDELGTDAGGVSGEQGDGGDPSMTGQAAIRGNLRPPRHLRRHGDACCAGVQIACGPLPSTGHLQEGEDPVGHEVHERQQRQQRPRAVEAGLAHDAPQRPLHQQDIQRQRDQECQMPNEPMISPPDEPDHRTTAATLGFLGTLMA
jgi:hypothetical protein